MKYASMLLLWVGLTAGSGSNAHSQEPKQESKPVKQAVSASDVVGAWRLVSVETLRPGGEVIYPFFGKHPEGLIVYDRSGWMSVQIISDPKPTVPVSSSREGIAAASPAEKAIAMEGYYAYCGTWTLDAAGSTVTHHIQQSLLPAERGQDVHRRLSLEGNRLTLVAKVHEMGEDHERRLVWEQLPPVLH